MENNQVTQYRKAKPWQLYLFSFHDVILGCFLGVIGYVTYLGSGYYGMLATTVALIATASRIFDGITDPIIAFIIERTDGRFGRYRPGMVLGWVICASAMLAMFFICPGQGAVVFIAIYAVYVIGYSFIMTAQGGARVVLTNEPVQRNRMGLYMGIIGAVYQIARNYYVSNSLMPKHGGVVDLSMMQDFLITMLIVSFIILVISVISLAESDIPENYRSLTSEKVSPKDMFAVMKNNRNFQMVLVACASDRIAAYVSLSTLVGVSIWGIIAQNYAFFGQLGLITFIPNIIIPIYGNQIAIKMSKKVAMTRFSLGAAVSCISIVALFVFGDPTKIGSSIPITAVFVILYCIYQGCYTVGNGLRMPMLADIADYEMSRNGGKQVAGVISAAYSLVDKCIVAFATTIVGFGYAAIGYTTTQPQIGDPSTPAILAVSLIMWMGAPILGYVLTLIAMQFYDLDNTKMAEVQAKIFAMKAASK